MKYMKKAGDVLKWDEIRRRKRARKPRVDFSGLVSCLHDFMFSC
jgi:hypothetical protein